MAHKLSMEAVHNKTSNDIQISHKIQPKRQLPNNIAKKGQEKKKKTTRKKENKERQKRKINEMTNYYRISKMSLKL